MAVVFLNQPQKLYRGDLIISRFNWRDPAVAVHAVVALASKSRFVHGTLYTGNDQEWSVEAFGPHLRAAAVDVECWAYRVNDPNWKDIGDAAAQWLLDRLPDAPKAYGWANAGFVGVQSLMDVQQRKPLKSLIPYCFEGITDAYDQIGFDVVPSVDSGAVLGQDIAGSPLLVRL